MRCYCPSRVRLFAAVAREKSAPIYGVLERHRRYYREALRRPGETGVNLLVLLETRLDSVVYRMGFADSRAQARQLVQHGHFDLNGRRTDTPSAIMKQGNVISVRQISRQLKYFRELRAVLEEHDVPGWLTIEPSQLSGRVLSLPTERRSINHGRTVDRGVLLALMRAAWAILG
jgi:small subunit ribosomal protein S4